MSSAPEVVFAGTDGGAITDLAAYEAVGGLTALRRAQEMTPEQIIAELDASSLRGRGGAFFPTGRKWSFVPKPDQNPRPHYLVVNADESEPGTFKDREIMLRVPFRFLEGCLIAARGIESQHVFVYIRGEYEHEWEILVSALEQLREAKLLGGVTIVLHRGAGAYICGEETALLESLEGYRGQPRTKPPFPAIAGLYASPTAVNNVESITTVTPIIEMGGAEYAKLGVEDSTGTRVFSLSGNVVRPGNYELPHGYPLRDLIHEVGGGIADGRTLKAVIPGRIVDADPDRVRGREGDARLRLAVQGRQRDRIGRRHRPRRPLLHGAARCPRLPVLRARVVRQVHAVPRRAPAG